MVFQRAALVVGFMALLSQTALAASFGNSLWLGNDSFVVDAATLYNVDRSGNVLQSFPNSSMTGVAIDPTTGSIYLAAPFIINRYGLNSLVDGVTPVPNGTVPGGSHPYEDMAFNPGDPNHLWRANYYNHTYDRIDLTTGSTTQFLSPLGAAATPMGMAWDGTQFWVSDQLGRQVFQMTTAGVFSGPIFSTGFDTGGLAWDSTDSTLWIGTFSMVHHFTTAGIELGSFAAPGGQFVDGLEFQATSVPEPSTWALMLVGVLGIGFAGYRQSPKNAPAIGV